jgi:hypothetical protein
MEKRMVTNLLKRVGIISQGEKNLPPRAQRGEGGREKELTTMGTKDTKGGEDKIRG